MDSPTYKVHVKMSLELLYQLLNRTDEETWLVLEGDLSLFQPGKLTGIVMQSVNGQGSRAMIPLTRRNVYWLKTAVLLRVGIRKLIHTIYLQKNDQILFSSCNYFRSQAEFSNWVTADFLNQLQSSGVITYH
jgi:hypothetical protein